MEGETELGEHRADHGGGPTHGPHPTLESAEACLMVLMGHGGCRAGGCGGLANQVAARLAISAA